MNVRTQINDEVLKSLAETQGPCITIVLPKASGAEFATHRTIAFRKVCEALKNYDCDVKALLQPVEEIAAHVPHGGLLILRSPTLLWHWVIQEPLPALAEVEDHFAIRHLLSLKDYDREFYILALSLKRVRLLRCTPLTAEEVELPAGTNVNLAEDLQARKPDHTEENMVSGGPSSGSMRGVMFSTSSDADARDEYLLHSFTQLARGVQAVLKDTVAPLVLAGVSHELSLYRRVNTYPNVVEQTVAGAPDAILGSALQERALALVREHLEPPVKKALDGFDKMVGTGHASTYAQEIVRAAYEGRILHLFLRPGAEYRGTFDAVRQKLKRHTGTSEPARDLLNDAAVETLRHGGSVHSIPSHKMPHGAGVAAMFRYAAQREVTPEGAQASV